jgi:hypothetical protein
MGDTNGFGNLPMVGGVPGLPPPNMPGQLGNIPTMGDQKTLLPNMQGSYGFEEEILDSLYLTIGNSDSLGLGYWLESGHLTDPGQIAEY